MILHISLYLIMFYERKWKYLKKEKKKKVKEKKGKWGLSINHQVSAEALVLIMKEKVARKQFIYFIFITT